MTFSQMQTEVGDLLNMTIGATSTVSSTQVKRDLNTARDLVLNKLLSLGQNYNVRLAKTNLVADQNLYGLPSDFRKLVRVEIGYEGASLRRKAVRMDSNSEDDPVDTVYLISKPRYAVRGDNIDVRPTPGENVTEGLWIWYVENPAAMVGDTDTAGLPHSYDSLLPMYAAAKGAYKLGLNREGNNFIALFRAGLEDLEQEVIERNIDDNSRILIRDTYAGL